MIWCYIIQFIIAIIFINTDYEFIGINLIIFLVFSLIKDSIKYIEKQYFSKNNNTVSKNNTTSENNKKVYKYVVVKYNNSNKNYTYLMPSKKVSIGDYLLIEGVAGKTNVTVIDIIETNTKLQDRKYTTLNIVDVIETNQNYQRSQLPKQKEIVSMELTDAELEKAALDYEQYEQTQEDNSSITNEDYNIVNINYEQNTDEIKELYRKNTDKTPKKKYEYIVVKFEWSDIEYTYIKPDEELTIGTEILVETKEGFKFAEIVDIYSLDQPKKDFNYKVLKTYKSYEDAYFQKLKNERNLKRIFGDLDNERRLYKEHAQAMKTLSGEVKAEKARSGESNY